MTKSWSLGAGGQTLLAPRGQDVSAIAGAGDVDGDGLADLVVGSPISDPDAGGVPDANEVSDFLRGDGYVVYGRRQSGVVDLAAAGTTRLSTKRPLTVGLAVAGPGDVDGDGLADVVLGAPAIGENGGPTRAGSAFVVFGARDRPRELSLDALGDRGFEAAGTLPHGAAGLAVAPAGDVDGDGRRDVLVGEPDAVAFEDADDGDRTTRGAAHVVFGARYRDRVPLDGARTLTLRGAGGDALGTSLAGGTDLDGDGRDEVLASRPSRCRLAVFDRPEIAAIEPAAPAGTPPAGIGGPGADRLSGGPVGDHLNGLAGNDELSGRDGHDCLLGGEGDDRLRGGLSGDALLGEAGADVLVGDSGCDKIFGGAGDDVISAGPVVVALAEALRAPIGARDRDSVRAGDGDDRVTSGSDRDDLRGEAGDDRLGSGAGDDTLLGGGGDDRLAAGPGADELFGGPGSDLLRGGTGDDRIDASGYDNDESEDEPGAREGTDTVVAGPGNDVVDARDGNRDVVDCGPGRDRVTADRRDRVRGCEQVRRARR